MARPVVLSNGELHVGLNKYGLVHDFYYPYVGLENHCAGQSMRHKIGVWIDGTISWLDDGSWHIESWTAEGALIGHTRAESKRQGVLLEFDDVVDTNSTVFLRNIHVVNVFDRKREIRVFLHQAFAIGDSRSNTDTAQYLPDSDAILHYRGRRAFVIGGEQQRASFDQHSIGLFGIEGHEGTYRDADDGELAGSNVEHGRVDSTMRFVCKLGAYDSSRIHYWVAAGRSVREALQLHKATQDNGLNAHLHSSAIWWHKWLEPARTAAAKLEPQHRPHFLHSALVIKAHIDKRGAVIASTDTAMLNYSRDAYAYCWPRDGAYALWPLIRLGYKDEPAKFFGFMRDVLNQGGYLMHKYRADGALGSSWHTYVHDSVNAAPIQEDETAITLFMFGQFVDVQKDPQLLDEFYDDLVKPMADFLAEYVDSRTGLPRPSYDLWEERFMVTTYTTAVTFAALQTAAQLAEQRMDAESAVKWRSAAEEMYIAARQLYNPARKHFYKGIIINDDQSTTLDDTIDSSSFFGAYMFGLFPVNSPEVKEAFETLKALYFSPTSFGMARYEGDNYNRVEGSGLGNYWFIASLWMSQFAHEMRDDSLRDEIIEWVESKVNGSLMLSEQLNPMSSEPLSVSPLVWSHAELMATLLDIIDEDES